MIISKKSSTLLLIQGTRMEISHLIRKRLPDGQEPGKPSPIHLYFHIPQPTPEVSRKAILAYIDLYFHSLRRCFQVLSLYLCVRITNTKT